MTGGRSLYEFSAAQTLFLQRGSLVLSHHAFHRLLLAMKHPNPQRWHQLPHSKYPSETLINFFVDRGIGYQHGKQLRPTDNGELPRVPGRTRAS